MTVRHLYQNDNTIYCAESLTEATELFERDMGESVESLGESHFEQIPDDKELEIGADEPYEVPGEIERRMRLKNGSWGGTYFYLTKKASEWAADQSESGHFSGGDY